MKHLLLLAIGTLLIFSCQNKKIETDSTDTLTVDTLHISSHALAFDAIADFSLKPATQFADSIQFFVIENEPQLDSLFEKNAAARPDFIINFNIAITGISQASIEKVEMKDGAIDVFVKADKAPGKSSAAKLFAIERRSSVAYIDFYVNGNKHVSLMLPAQ